MSSGARSGVVPVVVVLALAGVVGAPPALACPVSQQDELGRCPDEVEAAKKAEVARKAEEARRVEAARKTEEVRKAEEARHIEAARKVEEARRAEEASRAVRAQAVVALLAPFAFRSIPATGPGGYSMGSAEGVGKSDERPKHAVVLSGFLAMEHEVTQAEWASVIGAVPAGQEATGDRVPVAMVSWCDAVVFANRLTAKANEVGAGLKAAYTLPAEMDVGLTSKRCNELAPQVVRVRGTNGFRLPTEAEWEYLARGGKGDRFAYSGSNTATEVGWISKNSGRRPHDVCTAPTPRNGFGLCDLTGDVWEWTGDWYDAAYYGTAARMGPDPTAPESGSQRVVRGGGWWSTACYARVANRGGDSPGVRDAYLGVRLVRSSP